MTQAVVMRLVDPIKGRGHHVYMENYYTHCRTLTREEDYHTNSFRVTLATDLLYAAALVTGSVHYGPRHQSLQPAARLTERHFPISLGKSQLVG